MEMLLMLFLIGCIFVGVSVLSAKKTITRDHRFEAFVEADSQDSGSKGRDHVSGARGVDSPDENLIRHSDGSRLVRGYHEWASNFNHPAKKDKLKSNR